MHPSIISRAYLMALDTCLEVCERMALTVDVSDPERMRTLIRSCIGTKFVSRYGDLICDMALDAVLKVTVDTGGVKEIDIKRYAKVEKVRGGGRHAGAPQPAAAWVTDVWFHARPSGACVCVEGGVRGVSWDEGVCVLGQRTTYTCTAGPWLWPSRIELFASVCVCGDQLPGGELDECRVIAGVMVNKDVTHPKMRRRIVKPRIMLLDCPLEYKKAESQTTLEIEKEDDWNEILKQEEDYIEKICAEIIAFKPDIVFTEKGVSGEADGGMGGGG
jgi:chaperonin GroEL (HSP60 family)